MILFGNFLIAVGSALNVLINIFIFLFIARAILSWVSPDPMNPIVQFINNTTEPALRRIREKVPPLGFLDVSVILAIVALYFLQAFLVQSLYEYGYSFKGAPRAVSSGVGFVE